MKDQPQLKSGQTVYTADGREVIFAGYVDGIQFIRHKIKIAQYHDGFDDDPEDFDLSEPVRYSQKLYASEPTSVFSERIEKLHEKEVSLRRSIENLHQREHELKLGMINLEATAEKHEEFRLLVDYLEGRVTHAVTSLNYGAPKIVTIDELRVHPATLYERDCWPRAFGLFMAENDPESIPRGYGRKRVTWRAAEYYDGSGSWGDFIPCRSLSEAKEVVTAMFNAQVEEWRSDHKKGHHIGSFIEENDFLVAPSDWATWSLETRKTERNKRRAELNLQIQKLDDLDREDAERIAEDKQ